MYTKYTLYTGGVYCVYFAIPRLIRGLKQTGSKAELIAKAFRAYELNGPVKFTQNSTRYHWHTRINSS
jgi:hypothetical protein